MLGGPQARGNIPGKKKKKEHRLIEKSRTSLESILSAYEPGKIGVDSGYRQPWMQCYGVYILAVGAIKSF